MNNTSCPICESSQIKENIYQKNPDILIEMMTRFDSQSPVMMKKYICKNCGHSWEEVL